MYSYIAGVDFQCYAHNSYSHTLTCAAYEMGCMYLYDHLNIITFNIAVANMLKINQSECIMWINVIKSWCPTTSPLPTHIK